jgi:hypothetical protein
VTALMTVDALRPEPSSGPALHWLVWSMAPVVLADRDLLSGGPEGVDGLAREMDRIARRWAWGLGATALVAFTATGPWTVPGLGEVRRSSIWLGPSGAVHLVRLADVCTGLR